MVVLLEREVMRASACGIHRRNHQLMRMLALASAGEYTERVRAHLASVTLPD